MPSTSAMPTAALALPRRNTRAMPPRMLLKPRWSNSCSKAFPPEKRKKFWFSPPLSWKAT
ncbi:hypothetical protein L13192_00063 [Pyrenophora tritici-repentis]|nr:hypothetical protein L13192_00063 [Pyrenophora tritici-repentis]